MAPNAVSRRRVNVFALIREARAGLAVMPELMRILCGGAMVATPVLLVLMFVPLVPLHINGQAVSRREFWHSGVALVFASFLILGVIGSWGMALRRPGTRWAVVSIVLVPAVISQLLPASALLALGQPSPSRMLVAGCAYAIGFYLCLFHIPAVKRYFGLSEQ